MKTKNRRNLIIVFILFPAFLWLSLTFTNDNQKAFKPYSVLNKGKEGVSVIYEVLKKVGYNTNLIFKEVDSQTINKAQIVIEPKEPYKLEINDRSIRSWIEDGGSLIYLTPMWKEIQLEYGIEADVYSVSEEEQAIAYSFGKGLLVLGNPPILGNQTLTENTNGAYWIITQLVNKDIDIISFNEYYHYSEVQKPSLWSDIPKGIKFAIYQTILLIVVIIYYNGKRFGKEVPLYEEVERIENEYIYAVASLYKRGQLREIVIDNFYNDFLAVFEESFGTNTRNVTKDWIQIWEKEKLPELNNAKKLYSFINTLGKFKEVDSKKMLEIISVIEHLKKIIDRRRENHWKELRKDIQRI